jgi:hypothetical protein
LLKREGHGIENVAVKLDFTEADEKGKRGGKGGEFVEGERKALEGDEAADFGADGGYDVVGQVENCDCGAHADAAVDVFEAVLTEDNCRDVGVCGKERVRPFLSKPAGLNAEQRGCAGVTCMPSLARLRV